MTTHDQARQILERAVPGIVSAESLLVRIISVLESHYGDTWRGPGVGSHNWGSITAGPAWDGETFEYRDSRWNPETKRQESYVTRFRRYPTAEAGARDLHSLLTRGRHAVAAQLARAGRWGDISAAIGPGGTGYYQGHGPPSVAVPVHRSRFLRVYRQLSGRAGNVGLGLAVLALALLGVRWRTF